MYPTRDPSGILHIGSCSCIYGHGNRVVHVLCLKVTIRQHPTARYTAHSVYIRCRRPETLRAPSRAPLQYWHLRHHIICHTSYDIRYHWGFSPFEGLSNVLKVCQKIINFIIKYTRKENKFRYGFIDLHVQGFIDIILGIPSSPSRIGKGICNCSSVLKF